MEDIKQTLRQLGFAGDIDDSAEAKEFYSHDASMFEIIPELIVKPKDSSDLQKLVKLVAEKKQTMPELSVTARSAGTDMSGGAINDSIIVDFRQYFTNITAVSSERAQVQPGVLYRDFEPETLKYKALMPTYPASRDLASVGGMVNNNSGGEKSLEFGQTKNFVEQLNVVFADGNEYVVRPLTKPELDQKMSQGDFEGNIYKQIFELIESNYDTIKAAKPNVSKNSMGYNLWDVWDRQTGIFDLTKLIVGSQGTLGFVTDIHFKLVPRKEHTGLLVMFLKDISSLGDIIPKVLEKKPATFESFDDETLALAIKFMPSFLKMLGPVRFFKLIFSLIPDAFIMAPSVIMRRRLPRLVLMVEFNGDSEEEVRAKISQLHSELKKHKARYEIDGFEETPTAGKSEKFWLMRRQSFNLLRSKVKDKHTAPFIDDLIVQPKYMPEFLPKLRVIIKKYKLNATIAGHMGDGNFHIIPLMKLEDKKDRDKILPAMKEVDDLVLSFGGSLSGEHNDGLVRGPWLKSMYGVEVLALFQKTKAIMDPQGIFNPKKKADADWDYSFSHIREKF